MTFRQANLIHKRRQIQRRRIVPGVALAAAAVVAVVLLLVSTDKVQAEVPREEGQAPTVVCSGLSSITLTASSSAVVSRSDTTPSTACEFSLELSRVPPPGEGGPEPGSEACVVTATPSPAGQRGARVHVIPTGACSGVEIKWRVRLAQAAATSVASEGGTSSPHLNAQTGTWSTAHAFLLGEDVVDIDMYKNRSDVRWRHTSDSILDFDHYPSSWGTTHAIKICLGYPPACVQVYLGDGWTVEHEVHGVRFTSTDLGKAWNHANFHAHLPVLPDPRAKTKSILWFGAGGGFACDFSNQVANNYWFGLVSECAAGRSPS
ncbi:MAG: hypothetical protein OXH19_05755 [Chloroflexi bacterium]|nr:hypothetical protein [Chloroflexota bacterium]MCY3587599.1 hypothetical protein [Chloroflexota bacterium]MCY3685744.1 hypothetical protein [Chloroflexota bacterium]MDE2708035.1 hypothetical protein [Chloroflexota bacterium]MXX48218.1 hypothetical protein [Chloroflexota bacterium]